MSGERGLYYLTWAMIFFATTAAMGQAVEYPSQMKPGKARAVLRGSNALLENEVLELGLNTAGSRLRFGRVTNKQTAQTLGDGESELLGSLVCRPEAVVVGEEALGAGVKLYSLSSMVVDLVQYLGGHGVLIHQGVEVNEGDEAWVLLD